MIRGRLDVARYSRQQGRITVPRRYPIRLVERATATPENILAAYRPSGSNAISPPLLSGCCRHDRLKHETCGAFSTR